MHRMALCLALALSLGGCIDYKWGHDWKADNLGGWQDASTGNYDQGTSFKLACGAEPLYVSVQSSTPHQLVSLFLVPLFSASLSDDDSVEIRASHPGLVTCTSSAQNPLVLKMDNRVISHIGYPSRQLANSCRIHLDARELQGERLSIEVNQALLPCAAAPVTLKKHSYFCMRQSKFGGSVPCGR
ncbi:hypothetical protein NJH78_27935 [Pseudomonas chlororaphis]|uniref:hypothetical protein n=1 Tax=Pseudomonas chlororaphis TaxID=587753 RepID=UPI00209B9F00|nr:hypothetical protein [Pseudomonas chlororaphis]MCO7573830.1 hypothetical protein [Pseudomonas chlororaphis]MCO7592182.1 hypothetical protein [Pseudomonas chlororaphis]